MMLWWHALVLGVVEGITEFLPVSSTGHLLLVSKALGLEGDAFTELFVVAIQAGAMLAVVVGTWREWFKQQTWVLVLAGFLPTAAIGLMVYPLVKAVLFDPRIIAYALMIGGLVMIFTEWLLARRESTLTKELSVGRAVWVGVIQSLAVIPGVSRSAATIIGGRCLGMQKEAIVRFSFLLAVPTIGAATVLDVWSSRDVLTVDALGLLAFGSLISALVTGAVMQLFLAFIRRYSFVSFGIYRVLFGALVWWMLRG
jgi:undecaprenyl-diphosphatase